MSIRCLQLPQPACRIFILKTKASIILMIFCKYLLYIFYARPLFWSNTKPNFIQIVRQDKNSSCYAEQRGKTLIFVFPWMFSSWFCIFCDRLEVTLIHHPCCVYSCYYSCTSGALRKYVEVLKCIPPILFHWCWVLQYCAL